jgi:hypothetical protein
MVFLLVFVWFVIGISITASIVIGEYLQGFKITSDRVPYLVVFTLMGPLAIIMLCLYVTCFISNYIKLFNIEGR